MAGLWVRGALGSLLLTLGGFLTQRRLPESAWPLNQTVFRTARTWSLHLTVGWSCVVVGLALLTWAWLALAKRAHGRPDGVRLVYQAAAIWSLPLLLAPPLFNVDPWSYVADGYLTAHGHSPYVVTPSTLHGPIVEAVKPRWRHAPAPYGPVTLLWGALFAKFTSMPWVLMLAQRALAVLGLVLLGHATPALARIAGADPVRAAWLVVASPFVLIMGIGGAHNDLILAGLMATALLATARRPGWMAGAALAGLAAATKVPGAAVCVGVVLLSLPPRASIGARLVRTTAVGSIAAAVVVALGWIGGVGVGWIGALSVPVVDHSPLSLTTDLGWLLHYRAPFMSLDVALSVTRTLGMVAAVVVMAVVLLRCPTGNAGRILRWTAVVLLVVTVLSPEVRAWYFLWCVPALAWSALPPAAQGALVGAVLGLGVSAPLHGTVSSAVAAALVLVAALVGMSVWVRGSGGRDPRLATVAQ